MAKQIFDGEYSVEEFSCEHGLFDIVLDDIVYSYTPAERGSRDSMGVPLEPDWPEEIEFIEAKTVTIKMYFDEKSKPAKIPESYKLHDDVYQLFLKEHQGKIQEHIMESR
jgi:hypothetical protein